MISLTKKQIDDTIPKIRPNLDTYIWLQDNLHKCDVSKSREYQRKFNGYYRMIWVSQKWRKLFYNLFQFKKTQNPDFNLILLILFTKGGKRFEVSFSSKMAATINPSLPIIDSVVLRNLQLDPVTVHTWDKWTKVKKLYNKIRKLYSKFLASKKGRYLVAEFKKQYPDKKISEVKMLDFVLWSIRD